MTATTMGDCCPHWTGCLHCPECGEEAVYDDDPEQDPWIYVHYDTDTDAHYLRCASGHRYWFRDKT